MLLTLLVSPWYTIYISETVTDVAAHSTFQLLSRRRRNGVRSVTLTFKVTLKTMKTATDFGGANDGHDLAGGDLEDGPVTQQVMTTT